MTNRIALLAFLLLAGPRQAFSQTDPPCTVAPAFADAAREVVVDWHAAAECIAKGGVFKGRISQPRIDESVSVAIRAQNFNFINYSLKYQVDETVVESYVLLAKLWEQVLGLGGLATLTDPGFRSGGLFGAQLLEWINKISEAEKAIEGPRSQFQGKIHLDPASDLKVVGTHVTNVTSARDALLKAYAELPDFEEVDNYEQYLKVRPVHEAVLTKISAYLDLASLTLRGQVKTIGKKKGGTFVTITLTPLTRDGAERAPTLVTEYFSHSRLPLTFHSGYVGSGINDFEFEQVRALSGRDLFAVVKSDTDTQALASFLSYEVWSWRQGAFGLLATVGTDFTLPGERLYVGGSVKFLRRMFLTLGAASAQVQTGVSPVVEDAGDPINSRVLLETSSRAVIGSSLPAFRSESFSPTRINA